MTWTPQRKIAAFLVLTVLFMAPGFYLETRPDLVSPKIAVGVSMWGPGFAGLIVRLISEGSIAGIGWRVGRPVWLLLALALPVAYALPPYLAAWLTGLAEFAPQRWAEAAPYGLQPAGIAAALAVLLTFGLADKFSRALGEEIGWRGLLVPELLKITSFRRTAVISGLIWGAWHVPAMLYGDYGAAGTPLPFQIACFGLGIVAFSFLYAWLRMVSGSVWPAAILHAAHNLVVQSILDQASVDRGGAAWITTEFGLGLVLTGGLVAWAVSRRAGAAYAAS